MRFLGLVMWVRVILVVHGLGLVKKWVCLRVVCCYFLREFLVM